MLKIATKFALSVSLLGVLAAPSFAGPPKGMGIKSGPSMNSNHGSSGQLSRSLNNSRPIVKAPQGISGGIKLAERSHGNPNFGMKPLHDIKPLKSSN